MTDLCCQSCSKVFDNRKSFLRHGYYCRKAKTRVRLRKKSCAACTKAKTRCDLSFPTCARCSDKKMTCVYDPDTVSSAVAAQLRTSYTTSAIPQDTAPDLGQIGQVAVRPAESLGQVQPAAFDTDLVTAAAWSKEGWDFVSSGTTTADLPPAPVDIVFPNLVNTPDYLDLETFGLDVPLSPLNMSLQVTAEPSPRKSIGPSDYTQINMKPDKGFGYRKINGGRPSIHTSYILANLRSYPFMMLSGNSLPPFIHAHHRCADDGSGTNLTARNSRQGSMEVCAAVVQMFAVKNKSNVVFIWKTIRTELERLQAECLTFDAWEAVAALQATVIYYLLRIQEDDTEATNFDVMLGETMHKTFARANELLKRCDHSSWEGWILIESLRRAGLMLCLIDVFFDTTSIFRDHKCDGKVLASAPLPWSKTWRATTRIDWERDHAAQLGLMLDGKPLKYGDLMNFRSSRVGMFDPWLSQLDEFGSLVMATASLQQSG